MNTTRGTIATIFAAIQALLNIIIGASGKVEKGMNMLDRTIAEAEAKQLTHIEGNSGYHEEYLMAAAHKRAEMRVKYDRMAVENPELAARMEEAYAKMMRGLIARRKAAGLPVDPEDELEYAVDAVTKPKNNAKMKSA